MPDTNAPAIQIERYGPVTRAVHWLAALLVVAAFAIGLSTDLFPRGAPRNAVLTLHYTAGATVLFLLLVRLLRRLLVRPLPDLPGTSPLIARAAAAAHWALYAGMLALPLTGALDRWSRGRPLTPFGIDIPAPFAIPGRGLWEEAHELVAYALIALAVAHAAAALWHHFIQRDPTLLRMLPASRFPSAHA